MIRPLAIALCIAVLGACESPSAYAKPAKAAPSKAAPAKSKADLLAAENKAWDAATPVFQKYCIRCHTKGGKDATKKRLDHFNITSYPPAGHHSATIALTVRDVLGISGKTPKMPFGNVGVVQGDELAAIKAWTDAWQAADKGGAHAGATAETH